MPSTVIMPSLGACLGSETSSVDKKALAQVSRLHINLHAVAAVTAIGWSASAIAATTPERKCFGTSKSKAELLTLKSFFYCYPKRIRVGSRRADFLTPRFKGKAFSDCGQRTFSQTVIKANTIARVSLKPVGL